MITLRGKVFGINSQGHPLFVFINPLWRRWHPTACWSLMRLCTSIFQVADSMGQVPMLGGTESAMGVFLLVRPRPRWIRCQTCYPSTSTYLIDWWIYLWKCLHPYQVRKRHLHQPYNMSHLGDVIRSCTPALGCHAVHCIHLHCESNTSAAHAGHSTEQGHAADEWMAESWCDLRVSICGDESIGTGHGPKGKWQ